MKTRDVSKAKDPDVRASLAAMRRAAALARQTAIDTNTAIVLMRDGELVRIPAETLRSAAGTKRSAGRAR